MNGSELLTHDTVAWINGVRTRWHIPGLTVCAVSKDREGRSRDKQVVCLGQRNHRGDNIEASVSIPVSAVVATDRMGNNKPTVDLLHRIM